MKTTFMEVGTMLQETAQTREEAIKRFCESCDKCYRAGTCNESVCPIAKMHQARLLYFDAQLIAKAQPKHEVFFTVRQYNTSPAAQKRKRIRKILNTLRDMGVDYEAELVIDQADVYAEDERFDDVVYLLHRKGFQRTAKAIAKFIGLAEEV